MMPPMLAVTDIRYRRRHIRLWLPLFLIWVLLAPIAAIVLPLAVILSPVVRRQPVALIGAVRELLNGLAGLQVVVDTPRAFVSLRVL